MALKKLALASGLAVAAAANPLYRRQNETGSACASVSALAASQTAVAPKATPTVPAALAYDCINSVPINQTAALDLIKTIRPYWEWQSTLAYLKDPPAEYVEKIQDPIDVFAELDDLEAKVSGGSITKEYEVSAKEVWDSRRFAMRTRGVRPDSFVTRDIHHLRPDQCFNSL